MAAASTASTAIKRKIARLKREIERIDAFFLVISILPWSSHKATFFDLTMVGVGHSIPLLKNSTISTRQPFAQGLADIEFVEERNIHIEYRWAEERLRPQAVRL